MTAYARGAARERQVQEKLTERGWDVTRAAGSRSFDLVACNNGKTLYIEVKGTQAGPFADFGPAKRVELLRRADLAGASAVLIWWPPHKPLRWVFSSEWPN